MKSRKAKQGKTKKNPSNERDEGKRRKTGQDRAGDTGKVSSVHREEEKKRNTIGGLAQLARALDLHSRGQGFDSLILHTPVKGQSSLTYWEEKKRVTIRRWNGGSKGQEEEIHFDPGIA